MNDVHTTVARKLRSAAAALRADAAASNFVNLREALLTEIVELEKRADSLEEQAKPAIEEPIEFASVVKVKTGTLFVRIGAFEQYPWVSGACARAWDELDGVEVLRIGVGDQKPLTASDLSRLSIEANARKNGPRTMRVCISDVAPCGEQDCNSCFPIAQAP